MLDEQLNKIHFSIEEKKSKILNQRSLADLAPLKDFTSNLEPFSSCSIRDRCFVFGRECIIEESHESFDFLQKVAGEVIEMMQVPRTDSLLFVLFNEETREYSVVMKIHPGSRRTNQRVEGRDLSIDFMAKNKVISRLNG